MTCPRVLSVVTVSIACSLFLTALGEVPCQDMMGNTVPLGERWNQCVGSCCYYKYTCGESGGVEGPKVCQSMMPPPGCTVSYTPEGDVCCPVKC